MLDDAINQCSQVGRMQSISEKRKQRPLTQGSDYLDEDDKTTRYRKNTDRDTNEEAIKRGVATSFAGNKIHKRETEIRLQYVQPPLLRAPGKVSRSR
jgi:hypothetical protein